MKTFTAEVWGAKQARAVADALTDASQWYEFTPLPDECYEFKVKFENAAFLQQLIATASGGHAKPVLSQQGIKLA